MKNFDDSVSVGQEESISHNTGFMGYVAQLFPWFGAQILAKEEIVYTKCKRCGTFFSDEEPYCPDCADRGIFHRITEDI